MHTKNRCVLLVNQGVGSYAPPWEEVQAFYLNEYSVRLRKVGQTITGSLISLPLVH